jgi:hypothetical protein
MRARRTLTNRTAGFLLPGLLASIALVLIVFSGSPAFARTLSAPHTATVSPSAVNVRLPASADACLHPESVAASGTLAPRFKRRIFVEGTTSPSWEALKTARVEGSMTSRRALFPSSPSIRKRSASVSNRQRAP